MKYSSVIRYVLVCASLTLGGCASGPEFVKTSSDSYMLKRTDKGGSLDNVSSTKADMVRRSKEFAAEKGMVAVPISMNETPMAVQGFTSLEYQFQVMDKEKFAEQSANQAKHIDSVPEKQ